MEIVNNENMASAVVPIGVIEHPNPPLPDKVIAEQFNERFKVQIEEKKEGWWSVNLKGSKQGVLNEIDNQNIPDFWKSAIAQDIDSRCGDKFNFVLVQAQLHCEEGNAVMNYSVKLSSVL